MFDMLHMGKYFPLYFPPAFLICFIWGNISPYAAIHSPLPLHVPNTLHIWGNISLYRYLTPASLICFIWGNISPYAAYNIPSPCMSQIRCIYIWGNLYPPKCKCLITPKMDRAPLGGWQVCFPGYFHHCSPPLHTTQYTALFTKNTSRYNRTRGD